MFLRPEPCLFYDNVSHLSRVVDHDADLVVPVALWQSSPGIAGGVVVVLAVVLVQSLQLVGDAGLLYLVPAADVVLPGDDLVALLLDFAVDLLLDALLNRIARLLSIRPPTVC